MKKTYYLFKRRIEFTPGWGLSLGYCRFEENDAFHTHLIWGNIYINLPWKRPVHDADEIMDGWGFSFFGSSSLHLSWRDKTTIVHMPWEWEHDRTLLWANGGWPAFNRKDLPWSTDLKNLLNCPEVDYQYTRKTGEVQKVRAWYYEDWGYYHWRWFKGLRWLRWPRKTLKSIWVTFSSEIGEEVESWKGGVTGCGYDLQEHETPLECLRRMERERKFN